jgi:hypothetical protein
MHNYINYFLHLLKLTWEKGRRIRWMGIVARMGEARYSYNILVGKPEGKRPLGRSSRTWENNIRKVLKEILWDAYSSG